MKEILHGEIQSLEIMIKEELEDIDLEDDLEILQEAFEKIEKLRADYTAKTITLSRIDSDYKIEETEKNKDDMAKVLKSIRNKKKDSQRLKKQNEATAAENLRKAKETEEEKVKAEVKVEKAREVTNAAASAKSDEANDKIAKQKAREVTDATASAKTGEENDKIAKQKAREVTDAEASAKKDNEKIDMIVKQKAREVTDAEASAKKDEEASAKKTEEDALAVKKAEEQAAAAAGKKAAEKVAEVAATKKAADEAYAKKAEAAAKKVVERKVKDVLEHDIKLLPNQAQLDNGVMIEVAAAFPLLQAQRGESVAPSLNLPQTHIKEMEYMEVEVKEVEKIKDINERENDKENIEKIDDDKEDDSDDAKKLDDKNVGEKKKDKDEVKNKDDDKNDVKKIDDRKNDDRDDIKIDKSKDDKNENKDEVKVVKDEKENEKPMSLHPKKRKCVEVCRENRFDFKLVENGEAKANLKKVLTKHGAIKTKQELFEMENVLELDDNSIEVAGEANEESAFVHKISTGGKECGEFVTDSGLVAPSVSAKPREGIGVVKDSAITRTPSKFITNGDKFFRGGVIAVDNEKFPNSDELLEHPTRIMCNQGALLNGISHIFSPFNSESYVCSSYSTFKKLNYTSLVMRRDAFRSRGHSESFGQTQTPGVEQVEGAGAARDWTSI